MIGIGSILGLSALGGFRRMRTKLLILRFLWPLILLCGFVVGIICLIAPKFAVESHGGSGFIDEILGAVTEMVDGLASKFPESMRFHVIRITGFILLAATSPLGYQQYQHYFGENEEDGIYIDGEYYTEEEFEAELDKAMTELEESGALDELRAEIQAAANQPSEQERELNSYASQANDVMAQMDAPAAMSSAGDAALDPTAGFNAAATGNAPSAAPGAIAAPAVSPEQQRIAQEIEFARGLIQKSQTLWQSGDIKGSLDNAEYAYFIFKARLGVNHQETYKVFQMIDFACKTLAQGGTLQPSAGLTTAAQAQPAQPSQPQIQPVSAAPAAAPPAGAF